MCTAAQFGCAFSFSPSVCVSQHKLRHYSSVMSCVVHHWVSQERPWIAPDNITAGWHCFLCLWLCDDLVHLQKITDEPSPAKIGHKGVKKGMRKKQKVLCKWEAERHLLFKEQYSNREVRNEDRGRAVWKENNSQLLRRRMPWLQTDWAINRLIIYSLLIASVRGPSVRSLISAAPCIVTHHTQACLCRVFSCVFAHARLCMGLSRDHLHVMCVCVWLEHADSGLHSGIVER